MGTLYVTTDGPDGKIAAEASYPAGEWEVSAPLALSGVKDLYIVFGGDAVLKAWIAEN